MYNGEEYLHDVFPSGSAYGAGFKKKLSLVSRVGMVRRSRGVRHVVLCRGTEYK